MVEVNDCGLKVAPSDYLDTARKRDKEKEREGVFQSARYNNQKHNINCAVRKHT
jgi:hypothetical protein